MRKKPIYFLLAVVSLLLLTLIVIQLLWMRRATEAEQHQVKLHAIKALERVENELRNTNYCMVTYSKLFINPGDGFYMVHQHPGDKPNGPLDTVKMMTNDELFTHTDTILYDFASVSSRSPISADIQVRMHMAFSDTADYYREQKEFFGRTGTKRVSDIVASGSSISSMFDMDFADSLLHRHLASELADTTFGFGFIDKNGGSIAYARRVADSNELKSSPYVIDLFPDNKFMKPHKLAIVFATGSNAGAINNWLVLSMVIIVLLVISFYAFIRLYISQTRLSEMKSDFINNLTHEFNTPIANISLAVETLNSSGNSDPLKTQRILDIISTETLRLRDNVDRALQAASMDKGEMHLHKEPIDLVAVVNTIRSSYQLQSSQLGGHITFFHPTQLIIQADETHILNCVCNLLDNAIKYSRGAPAITITLQAEGKYATLSVTDNGVGMTTETQKHIFEKFYRAHEGDVHNTRGFGLGLNYVKGIVEAHQGKITVSSKPGAGTTFTIYLPL